MELIDILNHGQESRKWIKRSCYPGTKVTIALYWREKYFVGAVGAYKMDIITGN